MPDSPSEAPITSRGRAKAARRAEILAAAARLMAKSGFTGVRLEDIGAAVGISGPAMYRHFESKSALLDEMLVDISERLLSGGEAAIAEGGTGIDILRRLIDFHIDVLVTKPDLITVQDRDLSSLTSEANHRVRLLQRRYVERWVDVVLDCAAVGELPDVSRDEARVRVHAMFGLLNSSPMLPAFPAAQLRRLLTAMALAALGARTDADG
ncbi:TetR/AcrR family transcriptional regulator [Gordonia araii]|nr:TetR/AcrR family transcriptional regulator [Gordonia araii]NNG96529.1 TetR/AcrR family transcriptional regulator [Gordonia araii NBRC 100433]